ncbi:MAG: hypothetical protein AAF680_05510 [Pseudomonadota bacterium]
MQSISAGTFDAVARGSGLSNDRKRLALTLLLSLLIHTYALSVYDNLPRFFSEPREPTSPPSLEIQLARASLERRDKPLLDTIKRSLSIATDTAASAASSSKTADASKEKRATAAAEVTNTAAPTVAPQPQADPKIEGARESSTLITTLGSDWSSTEPDIACNPRERASKIRRCEKERSLEAMDKEPPKFEGSLGEAFARLNPSNTFRRDMLKVESLLEQQKQLTSMLAIHGDSDKDLQQQHLAVTDELKRIDKKYSSVNLFKVLGTGAKFTTALINQQRQKKK